jgi:hypothetical protein
MRYRIIWILYAVIATMLKSVRLTPVIKIKHQINR